MRELKILLDLSYLRAQPQAGGIRRIRGKKQNSDLLLHAGFRSGLSSNPVQARTLVSYDTEGGILAGPGLVLETAWMMRLPEGGFMEPLPNETGGPAQASARLRKTLLPFST